MLLIPAIDLKDGRCVRLRQGDMDDATVFADDPVEVARTWLELGARRLHLVDLNGAVSGRPRNEGVIREILDEISGRIPVQLGGGIRDLDTIERYLDGGLSYVIIGTAAVRIRGSCMMPVARSPARSSSGSTQRTAAWPPTAGANSPSMMWWTSLANSKTTAWKA
ncbi:MAG: hypothetical protein RL458_1387 [Pseudomonadota bacterium]